MSSSLWAQPPRQAHTSKNPILLSAVAQCPAGIPSPHTRSCSTFVFSSTAAQSEPEQSLDRAGAPGTSQGPAGALSPRVALSRFGAALARCFRSAAQLGGSLHSHSTRGGFGMDFSPSADLPADSQEQAGAVPALPQLCWAGRSSGQLGAHPGALSSVRAEISALEKGLEPGPVPQVTLLSVPSLQLHTFISAHPSGQGLGSDTTSDPANSSSPRCFMAVN